ncbi:MAG TPA: hypothetical protein VGN07_03005 [Steroidobacteraceae bacterium]
MPLIELPRALEEYFAFAETEPTRRGRRFSITLPFHNGERLERLQWWYHVSPAQERMFEGHGLAIYREQAIDRFGRHIERWLEITRKRLHGDDPIPRISDQQPALPIASAATQPANLSAVAALTAPTAAEMLAWPAEKMVG